jgi:hypothetical protein
MKPWIAAMLSCAYPLVVLVAQLLAVSISSHQGLLEATAALVVPARPYE